MYRLCASVCVSISQSHAATYRVSIQLSAALICYYLINCRQRQGLDGRRILDEEKLLMLEQIMRETSETAIESERRYDEVSSL